MPTPTVQLTVTDAAYSLSITGTVPLTPDMAVISTLFSTFATFNGIAPLASASLTSIVTLDGRTISRNLTASGALPASFSMTISSSQAWSVVEFQSIIQVLYLFDNLQLNYGVSALTITY